MKILNLYAGIGGNRKLWGNEHEITAVELNPDIAKIYKDFYPYDNVIIADAHEYLLNHFKDFDFIWSSPPCPSHSRLRTMNKIILYPDMSLYQEIILLQKWFYGKWIIENVIPYYEPLIKPNFNLHRHFIWCNFIISNKYYKKLDTCKGLNEKNFLEKEFNFNLKPYDNLKDFDKRKALRNCVIPEIGLHIFECMLKSVEGIEIKQGELF